jgi:hypothetical protein
MDTVNVEKVYEDVPNVITQRQDEKLSAQIARETLDRLISAVDVDNPDVDEYSVLGRLAVEAGLMWRCVDPHCRGINHHNSAKCDNCNSRKPRKHEVPKANPWF